METTHNQILHFQNIDKCEVGLQSPNMEREGMVRCLNFLINSGMKITEVVTDSSTSVAKTLGILTKPIVTRPGKTGHVDTNYTLSL